MNNLEKINVEVYLNGEFKKFQTIGSYTLENGPFGVEYINYTFPKDINDINSWKNIFKDLRPVDMINHLLNIKWLNDENFIKTYGKLIYNNYKSVNKEIEKLFLIIEDGLDGPNEENILFIDKGNSINYDVDFKWSYNYEWARRDSDFIILFDEEIEDYHSIYIFEDVYDEVIELLISIWSKLII